MFCKCEPEYKAFKAGVLVGVSQSILMKKSLISLAEDPTLSLHLKMQLYFFLEQVLNMSPFLVQHLRFMLSSILIALKHSLKWEFVPL